LNGFTNTWTYGWVGKGCQTIVVAHEIGHMFGAHHNREIVPPEGRPIEGFEYGYLIEGGYVTIMA
jgi:hypothetical protein